MLKLQSRKKSSQTKKKLNLMADVRMLNYLKVSAESLQIENNIAIFQFISSKQNMRK